LQAAQIKEGNRIWRVNQEEKEKNKRGTKQSNKEKRKRRKERLGMSRYVRAKWKR